MDGTLGCVHADIQVDRANVTIVAVDRAVPTPRRQPVPTVHLVAVPAGRPTVPRATAGRAADGFETFKSRTVHRVLTAQEEIRLAQRIEAGVAAATSLASLQTSRGARQLQSLVADGQQARAEFAAANIRLVISIATRYQRQGMDIDDLVQEGWFGLVRAVELFDYHRGCKFSTFSTWWIRQAIEHAVDNQSRTVRLPRNLVAILRRVRQYRHDLAEQLNRQPTTSELAQATKLDPNTVVALLQYDRPIVSLDATITDTDINLIDMVQDDPAHGPEETVLLLQEQHQMRQLLSQLGSKERDILCRRFGIGYHPQTLEEVAQAYTLSRERIRQIEAQALVDLRHTDDPRDQPAGPSQPAPTDSDDTATAPGITMSGPRMLAPHRYGGLQRPRQQRRHQPIPPASCPPAILQRP